MNNIKNTSKNLEALMLSKEVLKNFELSEISLSTIALKTARLARLLGEFEYEKAFQMEVSGYSYPNGIPPEIFEIAILANRSSVDKEGKKSAYTRSIDQIMLEKQSNMEALKISADPDIHLSYPNHPTSVMGEVADRIQRGQIIQGNKAERTKILSMLKVLEQQLSERKVFIYSYIMRKNIELEFSGNLYDVFHFNLEFLRSIIVKMIPDGVKKLNSIIENLQSSNEEDWSNAVHSCRKLLESAADVVFPPQKDISKGKKTIKLGKNNYINRLITFVEQNKSSSTYSNIVGSQLSFLGDRLDAIANAVQKGSHSLIKDRKEAEKYFIYTALLLSDILSLKKDL